MIPFVPVTVSRMTAATVWAPSYSRTPEVRRARADGARIRAPRRAAIRVRIEHPHDAPHPGLVRPAPRIARENDGAVSGAVVRAVAGDDLVAPRHEPSELDRVLVRLGAGVREERHAQVARRDLREEAPEARARLRGHRWADRRQLVGLLLDRRDDLRMLVADVDVDELRGEVEVALPVVVPERAAFRPGDRDRVDRVLHRPGVEDELLCVGDDVRAEIRVDLGDRHVGRS